MKNRRSFLKTMAAATAGVMVAKPALTGCTSNVSDQFGELLPQRLLGSTGEKVTMLGLGGAHLLGRHLADDLVLRPAQVAALGRLRGLGRKPLG